MTCITRFFRGTENDCVSDVAAVEKHEDYILGRGGINEDLTSKANFDAHGSIVEAQGPAPITANSGTLSGLDKVATQPGEAIEEEQGDIRGSVIENP